MAARRPPGNDSPAMSSSLRTLPGSREDLASAETLFDLLSDPEVETVTRLVGATAGLDLRRYQRSAVVRAVLRRMALAGEGDVENYLGRLAADALELRQLCRDLLVSDTAFFRDADAFAVVRDTVIKPLVRAAHGDPVRVWVVGCATGEEAYALAMLFLEAAEGLAPAPALRVFATDVDGAALDKAREGIYPASIADRIDLVAASRSRLETFFTHCEGGYQVSDRLRDVVTFGAHDVAHDAPLARIDLVSCRNLVGHLTDARRDVVVSRLCQALRPGGHLFLGAGEDEREVELRALDGRLGTELRLSVPIVSLLRALVALDAEIAPASLADGDRRIDPTLPPLPAYGVGLGAGLEVEIP